MNRYSIICLSALVAALAGCPWKAPPQVAHRSAPPDLVKPTPYLPAIWPSAEPVATPLATYPTNDTTSPGWLQEEPATVSASPPLSPDATCSPGYINPKHHLTDTDICPVKDHGAW
ncbi:MAG: hypothetical protein HY692_09525 [Cyanobacteria bacterium NC_groundwater_1444_Ag_S-0.65um_54_12]|nr:hypothetical protein [Cyanobacteria bacterium NC_groundwater_1444_Ag_S-0.65um_54_12]